MILTKAAAKITKNEAPIRQEYEQFKGNFKSNRKEQFHKINGILYEWFKKCCEENIYPDGQILKEEALEIEKHLNNDKFFNLYCIQRIVGKMENVVWHQSKNSKW